MTPPKPAPILKLVDSYSRMDTECWKLERFCSEPVIIDSFGCSIVAKTILQEVFLETVARAASLAVSTWEASFPNEQLPVVLPAIEDWLRRRDETRANELACFQPALTALSLKYWRKLPGNPAWAGRGLAWICDAPNKVWMAGLSGDSRPVLSM